MYLRGFTTRTKMLFSSILYFYKYTSMYYKFYFINKVYFINEFYKSIKGFYLFLFFTILIS